MIFHLPTLMLVVGYVVFWLELYVFKIPQGRTSPLAWIVWVILAVGSAWLARSGFKQFWNEGTIWYKRQDFFTKSWLALVKILSVFILAVVFFAHLFPPHLIQETDALNYHITLPRQHLILGSFQHIPWATADLYLLPVDFALAPFWLATSWPNKLPQFFFILGLLGVSMRLVRFLDRKNMIGLFIVAAAITGSHHIGIQMGTAMLDIVLAYLLLAALDSLLSGFGTLAVIEFAFYSWAKSFIPIQTAVIAILVIGSIVFLRFFGCKEIVLGLAKEGGEHLRNVKFPFKRLFAGFLLASAVIGGPFVAKSLYYAGTPLFPFVPGVVSLNKNIDRSSPYWQSLLEKAKLCRDTKDQYGSGRSFKDFVLHWWLIAVPEKGVNNRFDYPAGLMYLLFLGPFFYLSWSAFRQGTIPLLAVITMCWWATWWLGSHQTRFLLVPMIFMLILAAARIPNPSRIFLLAILLSLGLVGLSVYGAHHGDWGKSAYEVLREKDKELLMMNEMLKGKGAVLNFPDAAFADFPVGVRNNDSVFVINY